MPYNPLTEFTTTQLIAELRRRTSERSDGSGWIEGYLQPGDPSGRGRLRADQHGVRLAGGIAIVDTAETLVEFGLELIAEFSTDS